MATTANSSHVGAVLYADEASFAEVSTTFDQRLPIVNNVHEIIAGLEQSLIDPAHIRQYINEKSRGYKSVQGGAFPIRLYLTGHGSATTGSISATELAVFLGRVVGNSDAANVGGTVNAGTSAVQFSTTGVTTASGKMIRVGAINDAKGEGEFYYVNVAATLTVRNALAGTPANGDVIYAPELVYPSEGPTASGITSMRFQVLSADQQYNMYGCYPTSIEIAGLNIGETPMVTVMMACAAWETASVTFPTATATDFFPPAPVAGGALFIQDVGTTTRQLIDYRNIQIAINLQTVGMSGPNAQRTYQAITACRRLRCDATLTFDLDSENAGTDTWGGKWNAADASRSEQHAVLTLSTGDGQAVGFKFPNLFYRRQRPTQMDRSGVNTKTVSFDAGTGTDTTNDLTRAAWMLAIG